jgi:two-component system, LytTR family, response regulator
MNELKIIVIDDEQPARKKILSFLNDSNNNFILHEAANGIEAIEKINSILPDLVFLDIQMPGMTGFEIIEHIGVEKMPAVVFVTAYDQYAIDAFEVNAVDYLLKPFDFDRFEKALNKSLEKIELKKSRKNELSSLLKEINESQKFKERFLINHSGKYFFVQTNDINFISSEEKYVSLHTANGTYLMRETMNNMETKLDSVKFARIHRSFIVNVSQIKEIQPWSHGDYVIVLKTGEKINMSRRFKDRLMPE